MIITRSVVSKMHEKCIKTPKIKCLQLVETLNCTFKSFPIYFRVQTWALIVFLRIFFTEIEQTDARVTFGNDDKEVLVFYFMRNRLISEATLEVTSSSKSVRARTNHPGNSKLLTG